MSNCGNEYFLLSCASFLLNFQKYNTGDVIELQKEVIITIATVILILDSYGKVKSVIS